MATEKDVRRLALTLPETVEKHSYGTPGFRVRDRLFARVRPEGNAVVVWTSDVAEKDALMAAEPKKFFSTPHYDGQPTFLVRLDAVSPDELWEILAESWRLRAPTRLSRQFDTSRNSPKEP